MRARSSGAGHCLPGQQVAPSTPRCRTCRRTPESVTPGGRRPPEVGLGGVEPQLGRPRRDGGDLRRPWSARRGRPPRAPRRRAAPCRPTPPARRRRSPRRRAASPSLFLPLGPSGDSTCSPGSAASWSTSGRSGQHGSPPTRTRGSYRPCPGAGSACRVSSIDATERPAPRRSRSSRWKNRNSTPAAAQRLVDRGEHDLAHPGLHPPEDRSLVVEEHAAGQLEPQAGREPRPRRSPPS